MCGVQDEAADFAHGSRGDHHGHCFGGVMWFMHPPFCRPSLHRAHGLWSDDGGVTVRGWGRVPLGYSRRQARVSVSPSCGGPDLPGVLR